MHHVALPVSDLAAKIGIFRPRLDRNPVRDRQPRPAPPAPAPPPLALAEQARQPRLASLEAPDVAVDGLDADPVLGCFALHPSHDLLGRPSHGKAGLHAGPERGGAPDPRAPLLARPGAVVGTLRSVAAHDAAVAPDLAVDRRPVSVQAAGDLIEAQTHLQKAA